MSSKIYITATATPTATEYVTLDSSRNVKAITTGSCVDTNGVVHIPASSIQSRNADVTVRVDGNTEATDTVVRVQTTKVSNSWSAFKSFCEERSVEDIQPLVQDYLQTLDDSSMGVFKNCQATIAQECVTEGALEEKCFALTEECAAELDAFVAFVAGHVDTGEL